MALPATQKEIWKLATGTEKATALAGLASLPSRSSRGTEDKAAVKGGYLVALKDCQFYGLKRAIENILRGSLGHAFFPSPSELRMEHDKVMKPYVDELWRQRRRERENADYNREISTMPPPPTPEERDRVKALTEWYHWETDREKREAEEAIRAEIRAKYGMTEEVLAAIPDRVS